MNKSEKIMKRLESLHPKKIDLSLGRILRLLKSLDNPHLETPPVIHIAGTNGKGSTIAYLRAIFEKNNYNVHVYTSPHLINFNERIRINSKLISNDYLISLLEECEFYNKGNPITFFEITTAAAFLAFSRIKGDILLLETGLGGRYDATNVIESTILNIITPISMDHMNFLGNSIKKIANEKVGIFKQNVPAIISLQDSEAMKVINLESSKKKVELHRQNFEWEISSVTKENIRIKIKDESIKIPFPNLFGKHQILNSATAIAAVKIQKKFRLKNNLISEGITNAIWPARMQKINTGKIKNLVGEKFELWLDGGHNDHASLVLNQIFKEWNSSNIFIIIGMIMGKNPKSFIKNIIDCCTNIYVVPIENQSFIAPEEIIGTNNEKLSKASSWKDAINQIRSCYNEGKILICGSLYLAGEILRKNKESIF